jgi:hypothetical protein
VSLGAGALRGERHLMHHCLGGSLPAPEHQCRATRSDGSAGSRSNGARLELIGIGGKPNPKGAPPIEAIPHGAGGTTPTEHQLR